MTATREFIGTLESLKPGDLGLLRKHAGQALDESVDAFDLFAGLWWPLREKSQTAPRREVAWLTAKLYAYRPMPQADGATIALQIGKLTPRDEEARKRHQQRFDDLLLQPLGQIEPALQWALGQIAGSGNCVDWVRATDELSQWERETTRAKWAREFLPLGK